jgi:hypothetical protein
MNKREAFRQAKRVYPQLEPTRASGFTLTDDGKGVIIAGHEQPVVMVLHNRTDIYRLMGMCQAALNNGKATVPA